MFISRCGGGMGQNVLLSCLEVTYKQEQGLGNLVVYISYMSQHKMKVYQWASPGWFRGHPEMKRPSLFGLETFKQLFTSQIHKLDMQLWL